MPKTGTHPRLLGVSNLALVLALTGVGGVSVGTAAAAPSVVTSAAPARIGAPALPTAVPAARLLPAVSPALTGRSRRFALPQSRSSGRTWLSGVWLGGMFNNSALQAFGRWRGTAVETVTTYSEKASYQQIRDQDWSISTYNGFPGTLVYALALLPESGEGSLASIAAGQQDHVWRGVASNLVRHGRGRSIVRIGWEANGTWYRWGGTARTAATFRAAFRRVARVLKSQAPGLIIDFDITCGRGLAGSRNRMAPLTHLYPGNDVVDIIGCDHYDWWNTRGNTRRAWANAVRPAAGPGLVDVAAFARARRKGLSIPEWGLAARSAAGAGDNAYLIANMHAFFRKNRDVLVFENYFNWSDRSLASSLWSPVQNARASRTYRRLW